ncbi:MAG: hypothetical protein QMD06_02340 [Candidatus Altarchaeum sp.]|nr:hypothetical protein [Candidatus Altarchaeum sp.]
MDLNFSVLGICLGHQIIAHHFGGKVKTSGTAEYGNTKIFVDEEDEIFKGIDRQFVTWASHRMRFLKFRKILKFWHIRKYVNAKQ